jgi:predicted outer membrane repeat protein
VEDPTGGPAGPQLSRSPASLNFGTVNVGDTSSEEVITVRNIGGAPLSIISINISGAFAQTNDCSSLAAGATCTIRVTFKPTQNGPNTGTVEIISNSPTTPDTVSLEGVGDCEDKVWSLENDGPGTLRQLVKDADDGDTIGFCTSGTITLTSDDIEIDDDMTIDGTGPAITISGNTSNRIFKVKGGNDVTIRNITLQDGRESEGGAIYASWGTLNLDHVTLQDNEATSNGGAIYTQGTLNLDHVTLQDNEATSNGDGGAIYTVDDDIAIRESTLRNNRADNEGGGIYTKQGDLTIDKSTISNNTTVNEGGGIYAEQGDVIVQNGSTIRDNTAGSQGGGIYKYNGPLTINNSTIRDNTATRDYGGGIYNKGGTTTIESSTISDNNAAVNGGAIHTYSGALTVQDSTISNNTVGVEGGGIYKYEGVGGTGITVKNSTISGNSATTRGGGIFNYQGEVTIQQSTISDNDAATGGGIFSFAGSINLEQTIVADNTAADCGSGSAAYTSQGYNLDSDGTCGLGGSGDLPNHNARLGPLQDNGGPTHTHALQGGSDARDHIPEGNCATAEDQRDEPRPGSPGSQCDIGAVEMQP